MTVEQALVAVIFGFTITIFITITIGIVMINDLRSSSDDMFHMIMEKLRDLEEARNDNTRGNRNNRS